jgi:hypothetical protein
MNMKNFFKWSNNRRNTLKSAATPHLWGWGVKTVCVFALLCMGSPIYGQGEQRVYLGLGIGLDYGGLGGKIEYLPAKTFGVFGGLGYNLKSAGWNVGVTYKTTPDKKVSFNPVVFFGYNGISKVNGAPEYEMTSYGVTAGAHVDIKVGGKGDKLSVGVFVPVRSSKYKDNHDAMKNDPRIEIKSKLMPVAIGIGYNFVLK